MERKLRNISYEVFAMTCKRLCRGRQPGVVASTLLFLSCFYSGQSLAAAPVYDGTVSPNSLQKVVDQQTALNEQMSLMENRIKVLLEVLTRVDQLQKEVQRISGDVEVQMHDVSTMKNRQRDLYLDIDRRLGKMEKTLSEIKLGQSGGGVPLTSLDSTSTGAVTSPLAGTSPSSGGDSGAGISAGTAPVSIAAGSKIEIDAYQRAFNLLKEGRYDLAIASFQAYLDTFPSAKYSDNAQYWLGEANYVQRQFKKAIVEFKKVIDNYPTSPKVSDAMLKMGLAHSEVGEKDAAIAMLEQITKKYPGTTAARLATTRLTSIKSGK